MQTMDATMLSQDQTRRYQDRGFLLGPRVLSDDQIDVLCGETMRVIDSRGDNMRPQPVMLHNMGTPQQQVWQIVNIWQVSEPFAALMRHPQIVEAAAQLTDARELYIWHDQIQYKPAATGGANWWHQDSIYWPVHREKDQQLTAWVALDDADIDNGCMWMIPGSHRWGNQTQYLHDKRQAMGLARFNELDVDHRGESITPVACPVKRGHVHFHHPLTWHGSPANQSGRPRRAIALHYMTDKVTFESTGTHPMKPHIASPDGQPIRGDAFPRVWPMK